MEFFISVFLVLGFVILISCILAMAGIIKRKQWLLFIKYAFPFFLLSGIIPLAMLPSPANFIMSVFFGFVFSFAGWFVNKLFESELEEYET